MRKMLHVRLVAVVMMALGLFVGSLTAAGAQDSATPITDQPGAAGSLAVSAFVSDQVSQPVITQNGVTSADTGSTPSDRAFQLYLNGDFNSTPIAFSTVDGVASVDGLATGSYTLVDVQTQAQFPNIVIQSNTTTSLVVIFPSGPAAGDSDVASLAVSAFVTDSVNQPTAVTSDPISGNGGGAATPAVNSANADGGADIGQNVAPTDREFSIYLNGDLDSVPFVTFSTVGGSAVVNGLPVGTHALVDNATGFSFPFTIDPGSVTAITLYFPGAAPVAPTATTAPGAPTAVPTTAPGGGGTSGGGNTSGGGSTSGGSTSGGGSASTGGNTSVTALPNTGQVGSTGSNSTAILLMLGSLSLIALAAGVTWRRRNAL